MQTGTPDAGIAIAAIKQTFTARCPQSLTCLDAQVFTLHFVQMYGKLRANLLILR